MSEKLDIEIIEKEIVRLKKIRNKIARKYGANRDAENYDIKARHLQKIIEKHTDLELWELDIQEPEGYRSCIMEYKSKLQSYNCENCSKGGGVKATEREVEEGRAVCMQCRKPGNLVKRESDN